MLSVLIAVAPSAGALAIVSRKHVSRLATGVAGLALGAGIALVHFVVAGAMRMSGTVTWRGELVALAIAIALATAYGTLYSALRYRNDASARGRWNRVGAATFLGLALAAMHYTAMAALQFEPGSAGVYI